MNNPKINALFDDMNSWLKENGSNLENKYKTQIQQEIFCDDDVDRSGIEECKRRTEDLFKELYWSKQ